MNKRVACPLQKNATLNSNQPAIILEKDTLTYKQLHWLVCSLQKSLKTQHKKLKNTISVVIPQNGLSDIVLLWALWREGSPTAILNPKLPLSTLKKQVRFLNAKRIFGHTQFKKQLGLSNVSLINNDSVSEFKNTYFEENQRLTILYTSGSSATPKAAVHSFGNHFYNALGSNQNINLGPKSRWLLSLPLYHVSGLSLVFRSVLAGSCLVLPKSSQDISEAIKNLSLTHISLVPTQLQKLLDNKQTLSKLKSMKAILLGGSAIPANLLKNAQQLKLPVYVTYGLTEMASQVATSIMPINKSPQPACRVLPYRQLKISAEGEILVKGKTLFAGYQSPSGQCHLPLDKSGWFHTKDRGALDKNKNLKITGRIDNMFISGGENIQPEEIEHYLYQLKNIQRAVIIPTEDPQFGLRPLAFIKTTDKRLLNPPVIANFLSDNLPKFKIPQTIKSWPNSINWKTPKINRAVFQQYI